MRHPGAFHHSLSVSRIRFFPPALLCAGLMSFLPVAGCGTSCIQGVFNSGGAVSLNTSSCFNNPSLGTVMLAVSASAPSQEGPMAAHLLHVFVSIRGIEAHPSATADDDSPDWQELAPELAAHPAQIDLMARAANQCAANPIPQTLVPAGVYRQIRLRLVASDSAAGDDSSEESACGGIGPNCAVAANGKISPLAFENATPEFRILPASMPDGFFRVLPDTRTNLTIEFNTFSSLAVPSGESIQLIPVFTVAPATSCDSLATFTHPEAQ
jgi:Domain of unknown function (DUF4382)